VPVAGLAKDGNRVLVCGDRLLEPLHLREGEAEVGQRLALAVPVAGVAEECGSVLAGGDRFFEAARIPQLSSSGCPTSGAVPTLSMVRRVIPGKPGSPPTVTEGTVDLWMISIDSGQLHSLDVGSRT
jgi:hypothetical protein